MVHGKEIPPIQVAVDFQDSYVKSLIQSRFYSTDEMIKGNMPLFEYVTRQEAKIERAWCPRVWFW